MTQLTYCPDCGLVYHQPPSGRCKNCTFQRHRGLLRPLDEDATFPQKEECTNAPGEADDPQGPDPDQQAA